MFQIGSGSRGDVTILPTLVINNVQYRGRCRLLRHLRRRCKHLHPSRAVCNEMTRFSICREAGADGGAQGRVRRLQGGDGAPGLPQPRYDDRITGPSSDSFLKLFVDQEAKIPDEIPTLTRSLPLPLQTSRRTSACTGTAGAGATRPPTSRPAGTRTAAASASAPSSTASATRATATPTARRSGRAGAPSTTAGAGRRREGTRPSPPARYAAVTPSSARSHSLPDFLRQWPVANLTLAGD